MKLVVALSAFGCLVAQPALAGSVTKRAKPIDLAVHTLPPDFDLSQVSTDGAPNIERETVAPTEPEAPQGMDTRDIAWNPPAFEMALLKDGPVLAMGAMGSRKKGMPKLAHVVLDWDF